ncbi:hypothetical protein CDAR_372571 [Caerostris darwini]|uniref:Uncharacterized protein n=1 Tax=Caerostris darwini TaxID=1538125 RepID=A0AAV4T9G3_9ARAC|nr:hypothetical protein CDAR_372571 [Caerostris darwini]
MTHLMRGFRSRSPRVASRLTKTNRPLSGDECSESLLRASLLSLKQGCSDRDMTLVSLETHIDIQEGRSPPLTTRSPPNRNSNYGLSSSNEAPPEEGRTRRIKSPSVAATGSAYSKEGFNEDSFGSLSTVPSRLESLVCNDALDAKIQKQISESGDSANKEESAT